MTDLNIPESVLETIRRLEAAEETIRALAQANAKEKYKDHSREIHAALNAIMRAKQHVQNDLMNDSQVLRMGLSRETEGSRKEVIEERHESYGTVSMSKPSGGGLRLVGTMVNTLPSFVELRFHRARRVIDTHSHVEHYWHDHSHALLVVRMSTAQWAELITTPTGQEIPCTVDRVLGVQMDPVPNEVTTPLDEIARQSKAELRAKVEGAEADFLKSVKDIQAALEALGLPKKKAEIIQKLVSKLNDFSHVPRTAAEWASIRLGEDTEKFISQARVELAVALQDIAKTSGIALPESAIKLLTNS